MGTNDEGGRGRPETGLSPLTPPALWHESHFGVFRDRFTAEQQHELLQEDLRAELRVSAILAAVFGSGLLLAGVSILLILLL